MTEIPYTAQELSDAWREDIRESGFWQVSHTDDPRIIPATNRTPLRREDVRVSFQ